MLIGKDLWTSAFPQRCRSRALDTLSWRQLDEYMIVPVAFKTWVEEFVIRDYHPTYDFFYMWLISSVGDGKK